MAISLQLKRIFVFYHTLFDFFIVYDLIAVYAPVRTHKHFVGYLHNSDNGNDNDNGSDLLH